MDIAKGDIFSWMGTIMSVRSKRVKNKAGENSEMHLTPLFKLENGKKENFYDSIYSISNI